MQRIHLYSIGACVHALQLFLKCMRVELVVELVVVVLIWLLWMFLLQLLLLLRMVMSVLMKLLLLLLLLLLVVLLAVTPGRLVLLATDSIFVLNIDSVGQKTNKMRIPFPCVLEDLDV